MLQYVIYISVLQSRWRALYPVMEGMQVTVTRVLIMNNFNYTICI